MLKSRLAAGAIAGLVGAFGMSLHSSTAHALTPVTTAISIAAPSNVHQAAARVVRRDTGFGFTTGGMAPAIGGGALALDITTAGGGILVPGGVMDQDGVLVGDGVQGSTSVSAAEA
jgi:hypothetical protein